MSRSASTPQVSDATTWPVGTRDLTNTVCVVSGPKLPLASEAANSSLGIAPGTFVEKLSEAPQSNEPGASKSSPPTGTTQNPCPSPCKAMATDCEPGPASPVTDWPKAPSSNSRLRMLTDMTWGPEAWLSGKLPSMNCPPAMRTGSSKPEGAACESPQPASDRPKMGSKQSAKSRITALLAGES